MRYENKKKYIIIKYCIVYLPFFNYGKWELVSMDNKAIEADEKIVFEFRSDGTFDFVADSNAVLEGSQTGDWLWYNNKSTLELTYNTTSILTFRELTLNDEEFIATLNSFVVFDMKKID